MSDRELLELAAKAAGYKFVKYHEDHGLSGPWAEINKPAPESCTSRWNPIENDGDALRLAVKLGMDIRIYGTEVRVYCCGIIASEGPPDFNSATRRAIVRAAAGIGRSMP